MIKFRVRQAVKKDNTVCILLRPVGTTGHIQSDCGLPLFHLEYVDSRLKRVSNLGKLTDFDALRMKQWMDEAFEQGYDEINGLEINSDGFSKIEFLNIIANTTVTEKQIQSELPSLDCYRIKNGE